MWADGLITTLPQILTTINKATWTKQAFDKRGQGNFLRHSIHTTSWLYFVIVPTVGHLSLGLTVVLVAVVVVCLFVAQRLNNMFVYADTGQAIPGADRLTPGAWQGRNWSDNYVSHW